MIFRYVSDIQCLQTEIYVPPNTRVRECQWGLYGVIFITTKWFPGLLTLLSLKGHTSMTLLVAEKSQRQFTQQSAGGWSPLEQRDSQQVISVSLTFLFPASPQTHELRCNVTLLMSKVPTLCAPVSPSLTHLTPSSFCASLAADQNHTYTKILAQSTCLAAPEKTRTNAKQEILVSFVLPHQILKSKIT